MRKSKTHVRRLAIQQITIRTLGDRGLSEVTAGWECSARTSGNILCRAPSGDPEVCGPAQPS
jgi:hypothetical protein